MASHRESWRCSIITKSSVGIGKDFVLSWRPTMSRVFRFQRAPGAPEQWLPLRKALLIVKVNREAGRTFTVKAACHALAKTGEFGSVRAERLRRQYYDAKCEHEPATLAKAVDKLTALDKLGHLAESWVKIAKNSA